MKKRCITNFSFLLLLLCGFFAEAQNSFDTVAFKKSGRVTIDTSHPGADNARATYLLKNISANVPVTNGAPVGKYSSSSIYSR